VTTLAVGYVPAPIVVTYNPIWIMLPAALCGEHAFDKRLTVAKGLTACDGM